MSDTPDTAVGASSVYDNAPSPSPGEVSSASNADAIRDYLGASTDESARFNGGVTQTVTQTPAPGFPAVTFHRSSFGYDLPLG